MTWTLSWGSAAWKETILCARVSFAKPADDLQRQIAYRQRKEPQGTVITDIASGLNFKRQGRRAILERCLRGDQLRVVVAHRLARFGFELVEWLVQQNGGEVVVLHKSACASPTTELTEDLLAVLGVFGARLHGLRKYRNPIAQDPALSNGASAGPASPLAGDGEVCL